MTDGNGKPLSPLEQWSRQLNVVRTLVVSTAAGYRNGAGFWPARRGQVLMSWRKPSKKPGTSGRMHRRRSPLKDCLSFSRNMVAAS